MTFIERASRVMTPITIGATFGVAASLLFGSFDLATTDPVAGNHLVPIAQPVRGHACGCAAEVALAERAL